MITPSTPRVRRRRPAPQTDLYGPVSPWPRPIPMRRKPAGRDDLFVLTLGEVATTLADGTFDPVHDRVTLADGTIIDRYFQKYLGIEFYEPMDKSAFPLPPSGWCSWYYYYWEISAAEMLANARWIAEHLAPYGARYVQVDDGWQDKGRGLAENRDWTVVEGRFAGLGMDGLAREIRAFGLEAGIWLVPHGQSNPTIAHQDGAFAFRPDGSAVAERWVGNYLLDPATPGAHGYLRELFTRLRDWGYTYFKIDGQPPLLRTYYANAEHLTGDTEPGESPEARVNRLYRTSLAVIKETIGRDSYLLGCWGIPLPAAGLVDGCRTEDDVVQGWEGFLLANQTTQEWMFLHNIVWYCDPDVFYVRQPLPEGVARAWATLQGLTGQALLTSDRLTDLPPDRVELLRRIYPAVDIRPLDLYRPDNRQRRVWDLKIAHDGRRYDVVGAFNFDATAQQTLALDWMELGLSPYATYHVYDFWQGMYLGAWDRGVFVDVPPQDARVLTLVPAGPRPTLISTSRHITQGWVDLCEYAETEEDGAPVLRGRSRVIGGDPYTLTIGLPRTAPHWRLATATLVGRSPGVKVTWSTHLGYATVTFASAGTREVAWELRFAPDTPYRYPGGGFHFRTVTNTPLPDGDVLVQWTTPFQPFAACQVTLDDQVIGYTFSNRAVLRTPAPGRHRLAVRVAWYDGTLGPPLEAEIDIPDHG